MKIKINSLSVNFGVIDIDSKIIDNPKDINFVIKEIESNNNKINNITLIYRAKEDGDTIEKFHSKCDNKSNTLMIIKTTKGYIFGGFTKSGWKNVKGEDIYDDKALCFSLNLKRIYNIKNPKKALHCQSVDGRPSFGSDNYAFLIGNNFLSNNINRAERIVDYKGEKKEREINGGNEYFKIEEMEVFQILF